MPTKNILAKTGFSSLCKINHPIRERGKNIMIKNTELNNMITLLSTYVIVSSKKNHFYPMKN